MNTYGACLPLSCLDSYTMSSGGCLGSRCAGVTVGHLKLSADM